MSIHYTSGIVSFLICLGILPIVNRIAGHLNLYDAPGPLKIHRGLICRLGGAAMMAGFLAGGLFLYFLEPKYLLIFSVFVAVWMVGLIDDIHSLGPTVRFIVHIAAGAALWFGGWRLQWFTWPLLDLMSTCLVVAFLINAMNLLDGMDGLAAGTAAVICMGFLAISATDPSSAVERILAFSLLGACTGMLSRNAPPAKMFMGDSGSTLIGIVLAFLSLNWVREEPQQHSIVVPFIFLGVPIADAVLAILRRGRTRASLFRGDRRHFYDLLLRRGHSAREVFVLSIGISGTLVIAGWLSIHGIFEAPLVAALILLAFTTGAYLLGSLRPESIHVQADQQQARLGPALD